jgi:tRNA1Val (adenine37-N6)-methyltransferase
MAEDEDLSILFNRFQFAQARTGWRFGIDAVVLARHVLGGPGGNTLEIGTGCGVISILLAGWGWAHPITAVEIQPALADRARRNIVANKVDDQVLVIEGDANDPVILGAGRKFDRIFSNPPFHKVGSGRMNPDPERAAARHELFMNMSNLLDVIAGRLTPSGLATVLYPFERLDDLIERAAASRLSPVRTTNALPAPGEPPHLVLVDLMPGLGHARDTATPILLDRSSWAVDTLPAGH